MKIHNIIQTLNAHLAQKRRTIATSSLNNSEKDHVEISSKARDLQKSNGMIDLAKIHINKASGIRQERLAEAKQKIEQGFYSSSQVLSKVADNILKGFGL